MAPHQFEANVVQKYTPFILASKIKFYLKEFGKRRREKR